MSKSKRDRAFWKLRRLAKDLGKRGLGHPGLDAPWRETREYSELKSEFDRLRCNYGCKSMVMDKRRRGSTRRGNQAFDKKVKRIEKLRERRLVRSEVQIEADAGPDQGQAEVDTLGRRLIDAER